MLKSGLGALIAGIHLIAAQITNSILFEHATVISFNDQTQKNEALDDTSILVQGDTITAIFSSSTNGSVNIPADVERVSAKNTIISPGFIDTHRHAWETSYRTIQSNITMAEYFIRYGPGTAAAQLFTPNDIYLSQLVGLWEALNSGVTSILDHAHGIRSQDTADASLNANIDSGARVWFAYSLDSGPSFPLPDRIAHLKELMVDNRITNSSLVELGISYDSWLTDSNEEVSSVISLIKNNNLSVVTSHWVGGAWNISHNPSLFLQLGLFNQSTPIVLSHATFVTQPEYQLLQEHNQYVAMTPESEMHYGHTNVESAWIMDQAALGIDSHAAFSGDLLTQARLLLQTVRHREYRRVLDQWEAPHSSPMSVNQAFYLATRSGALALRRDDLGVIRVGAKADIVVFNGRSTNMVGWRDPIAAIVLHSHVSDIRDVMVGGSFVKRNGTLVADNLANITERFAQSARRIQDQAVILPWEFDGGFVTNPSLPAGFPPTVDVLRGNGTGY